MQRIESRIDVHSETFLRQQEELTQLVAELRERQRQAREVRPPRDLERIRRQGKLLPRERLELLLDPGTPFLEFSSLAGGMHHGGEAPSAR